MKDELNEVDEYFKNLLLGVINDYSQAAKLDENWECKVVEILAEAIGGIMACADKDVPAIFYAELAAIIHGYEKQYRQTTISH